MTLRKTTLALLIAASSFALGCADKTAPNTSSRASASSSGATATTSAGKPLGSASASPAPTGPAVANEPPKPGEPPHAIDMHVDTPWQVKYKGRTLPLKDGMATMEMLKAGKYGGIVYPIYIPDYLHDSHPTIQDADEIFDAIDKILAAHPDVLHSYMKGPTPPGMVTAYMSIEGAGAFSADITQIDRFIERGVVFVGPVHWHDSALATSATGKDKKHGLSSVGKQFCERVYAAGGLVDVSHMSDKGFADVVTIAEKFGAPMVATHSNARAITKHPRNLTDEQLKTIAKTNGIVGLNFYEKFVAKKRADVDDLVKHALHMIEVMGAEHVGIGSDFEGGEPAAGLENAGRVQALAQALRKAGVSEADVQKIFSENAKRVIQWSIDHRKKKG